MVWVSPCGVGLGAAVTAGKQIFTQDADPHPYPPPPTRPPKPLPAPGWLGVGYATCRHTSAMAARFASTSRAGTLRRSGSTRCALRSGTCRAGRGAGSGTGMGWETR